MSQQVVVAEYYAPEVVFKVPKGIDLNDKSVVENWFVRRHTLYIKYVGKDKEEEHEPVFETEEDFKFPNKEEVMNREDCELEDFIDWSDDEDEEEEEEDEEEEEEEALCKNCDPNYEGRKELYCIMCHKNCGRGLPHITENKEFLKSLQEEEEEHQFCWDIVVEDPNNKSLNIHDKVFYKLEDAEEYCDYFKLDKSIIRKFEKSEDGEFNFDFAVEEQN